MSMLSEKELEKVVGGILTPEAEAWINNNYDELYKRAKAAGFNDFMINFAFNAAKTCASTMDINALKDFLAGYGVDVSGI